MKDRELFEQAMDHIEPSQIDEASRPKKKRRILPWIGAVAAALAVVITVILVLPSLTLRVGAVSLAEYPEYDWEYRRDLPEKLVPLHDFWKESLSQILAGNEENAAFSPVNLSMGLSIAAELTAGNSRQQILDTLNIGDTEQMRELFHEIWLATYLDDGDQTLLANSLWLDENLSYDQRTMDMLAEEYYTSVYRQDLSKASDDIRTWLNQQTGNLLKKETSQLQLPEDTLLALYSTIYYRAKWVDSIYISHDSQAVFHGTQGDTQCTFMNTTEWQTNYFWGEDYSAVGMGLKDSSTMWLILPDEGKTVDDVLTSGAYYEILMTKSVFDDYENSKYMIVNLTIPKFDIRQQSDLAPTLQQMGIADIFDPGRSDFSSALDADTSLFFTAVNQATRVTIDEIGVTAANYIEFPGAGAAPPPEEIFDFVLDRPFLFVITNRYGIPLFAGVVNQM